MRGRAAVSHACNNRSERSLCRPCPSPDKTGAIRAARIVVECSSDQQVFRLMVNSMKDSIRQLVFAQVGHLRWCVSAWSPLQKISSSLKHTGCLSTQGSGQLLSLEVLTHASRRLHLWQTVCGGDSWCAARHWTPQDPTSQQPRPQTSSPPLHPLTSQWVLLVIEVAVLVHACLCIIRLHAHLISIRLHSPSKKHTRVKLIWIY